VIIFCGHQKCSAGFYIFSVINLALLIALTSPVFATPFEHYELAGKRALFLARTSESGATKSMYLSKARTWFNKAIQEAQGWSPSTSDMYGLALKDLGDVCYEEGDFVEARSIYSRAVGLLRKSRQYPPNLASALESYANSLKNTPLRSKVPGLNREAKSIWSQWYKTTGETKE